MTSNWRTIFLCILVAFGASAVGFVVSVVLIPPPTNYAPSDNLANGDSGSEQRVVIPDGVSVADLGLEIVEKTATGTFEEIEARVLDEMADRAAAPAPQSAAADNEATAEVTVVAPESIESPGHEAADEPAMPVEAAAPLSEDLDPDEMFLATVQRPRPKPSADVILRALVGDILGVDAVPEGDGASENIGELAEAPEPIIEAEPEISAVERVRQAEPSDSIQLAARPDGRTLGAGRGGPVATTEAGRLQALPAPRRGTLVDPAAGAMLKMSQLPALPEIDAMPARVEPRLPVSAARQLVAANPSMPQIIPSADPPAGRPDPDPITTLAPAPLAPSALPGSGQALRETSNLVWTETWASTAVSGVIDVSEPLDDGLPEQLNLEPAQRRALDGSEMIVANVAMPIPNSPESVSRLEIVWPVAPDRAQSRDIVVRDRMHDVAEADVSVWPVSAAAGRMPDALALPFDPGAGGGAVRPSKTRLVAELEEPMVFPPDSVRRVTGILPTSPDLDRASETVYRGGAAIVAEDFVPAPASPEYVSRVANQSLARPDVPSRDTIPVRDEQPVAAEVEVAAVDVAVAGTMDTADRSATMRPDDALPNIQAPPSVDLARDPNEPRESWEHSDTLALPRDLPEQGSEARAAFELALAELAEPVDAVSLPQPDRRSSAIPSQPDPVAVGVRDETQPPDDTLSISAVEPPAPAASDALDILPPVAERAVIAGNEAPVAPNVIADATPTMPSNGQADLAELRNLFLSPTTQAETRYSDGSESRRQIAGIELRSTTSSRFNSEPSQRVQPIGQVDSVVLADPVEPEPLAAEPQKAEAVEAPTGIDKPQVVPETSETVVPDAAPSARPASQSELAALRDLVERQRREIELQAGDAAEGEEAVAALEADTPTLSVASREKPQRGSRSEPKLIRPGQSDGASPSLVAPMFIQGGGFRKYSEAKDLQRQLLEFGPAEISTRMVERRITYLVRVGPLYDAEYAENLLSQATNAGHRDLKLIIE